jgi:hypothetical protein
MISYFTSEIYERISMTFGTAVRTQVSETHFIFAVMVQCEVCFTKNVLKSEMHFKG